jgi:hypothetical protein
MESGGISRREEAQRGASRHRAENAHQITRVPPLMLTLTWAMTKNKATSPQTPDNDNDSAHAARGRQLILGAGFYPYRRRCANSE